MVYATLLSPCVERMASDSLVTALADGTVVVAVLDEVVRFNVVKRCSLETANGTV